MKTSQRRQDALNASRDAPLVNVTVVSLARVEFEGDTSHDVLAVGTVSEGTLQPLVIANPVAVVAAGHFRALLGRGGYRQ
jgi:hypothetical protein